MKTHWYQKIVVAMALLCAVVVPAYANVIDFDELAVPNGTYVAIFPSQGYQGFTWSGGFEDSSWAISAVGGNWFPGTQAHSGQNFVWSNGGTDLSLSGGGALFDVYSLWSRKSGWGGDQSPVLHGFSGGLEVFTQQLELGDEYQKYDLNFIGIDKLTVTDQGGNMLMDDISVSAVPEPETYAMMLVGLVFFGFTARRRNKR